MCIYVKLLKTEVMTATLVTYPMYDLNYWCTHGPGVDLASTYLKRFFNLSDYFVILSKWIIY